MKHKLSFTLLCLSLSGTGAMAQNGHNPVVLKNQQTIAMKTFSLLVRVPVSYTTAQAKAVGPEWDQVLAQWKAAGIYVTSFAFPGTSYVVAGPEKEVRRETVICDSLKVVSNIVLQATDMEQALLQAGACPVLAYGGTVEVREIPQPRFNTTD
ncbi:hypothetical protein [Taibaiella chishuiensis]|uniref:YCII-related domain-containing protein n=1 Tax=Taibaiella chishuiensis TaxID=1434707 RepID=A0A2P8DDK6_9BACT|nr:hypothetical protein [Taibaiella chishuiensis]PSK95321.1 hypothetical protein B0I18_1011489 [Taibaiella chishuiensis]